LQTALDNGDDEAALSLAEKALTLHPKQGWILKIVYNLQIRLRQWYKAEKTLTRLEKSSAWNKEKTAGERLALYLAQAEKDIASGHKTDAALMIKKAIRLNPAFTPAIIMLAQTHKVDGYPGKAQSIILKAWKTAPHGALAAFWMKLLEEKKSHDKLERLRWIEKLLKTNKASATGQRIAGQAAMEAGIWGEARDYFKKAEELSQGRASAGLYRSLAALEERSTHNETAIKHWLNKAADAPADKTWICRETGRVYDRWSPIAEPHGSFNTIIWAAPYNREEPVLLLNDNTKPGNEMSEALIEAPGAPERDTL
jgi:HemY protein